MTTNTTIKKRISIGLLIFCSILSIGQVKELSDKVREIQLSTPESVATNKLTFEQEVNSISPGYLEFSVTEINDKGQAEQKVYSFGLSDLDKRNIRSFTHKDRMLVEVRTNGNQKLIQRSWDGGNKVDYIGDFLIYTRNAVNGRNLKKAFEEAIPVAVEYDKNELDLDTYSDHLEWLENNLEDVSLPKEEIGQELIVDKTRPAYVTVQRSRRAKKESWAFNLSLLNPLSVRYEMSGSELALEIWTKNNLNAIKYFENGNPRDFGDKLVIYAPNVPHAKKIHRVLTDIVPLAETHFGRYRPDVSTIQKALEYINEKIKGVAKTDGNTEQHMVLEDNLVNLISKETDPKGIIENEYIFDINDINPRKLVLNNDKTRFLLELHTKNGQPFIRHIENGQPRNFRKYVRLFFDDIDEALFAEEALQTIIEKNENKLQVKQNASQMSFYEGLEELRGTIGQVANDDIQYDQDLELLNREMSAISFKKTISEPKKTRELVYEFSTRDVNRNNMRVEVSGNRVWVELFTKGNEKLIKFYENGKVQNYQYRIPIEATDIVNAKEIIGKFKKLEDLDAE